MIRSKGIIHVTGEGDSGKTTFALGASTSLKDTAFIDDDIKGKSIVNDVGVENFGFYIDLIGSCSAMRETEFYAFCMNLIEKELPRVIKEERKGNKFELLVWDTWAKFENTFQPIVQKSPSKYREVYSAKGDIKGAQIWQASFDLEIDVLAKLLKIADCVVIVSHLKSDSLNGVKTGKQVPDSKKPLMQKSGFRVYLKANPDGAAPIGLILKRPAKRVIKDGELITVNILPRKMNPITWERIDHYIKNPVGDIAFLPGEQPTEDDLGTLSGILTREQMEVFRQSVDLVRAGISEDAPIDDDNEKKFSQEDIDRAKVLKSQHNKTYAQISKELGVSVPDVIKMLGM